jgi:hypothetical protein
MRRVRSAGLLLTLLAVLALGGGSASALTGCAAYGDCCKVCHKGKACGDTCISRAYTCHVGAGCACDG